ncbi:MAG: hypothetical protein WDO73_27360 [Ignavibacteriota bacterium]
MVNQVAQNAANSYSLTFDPGADSWNNKWHHLRISCERKGVKLQVRERYYAVPDSRSPIDRMKAVLMEAFQNPMDHSRSGFAR